MPEDLELDEITARLVTELAASITPTLTQNLNSAVHESLSDFKQEKQEKQEKLVNDFANAVDRTNMISKDLQNQIEKSLRSNIEDNRAARTMIMQSMRNVFDEITALRKNLDKVPEAVDSALKNIKPAENKNPEVLAELDKISNLVKELIDGLRNFSETYARDKEQRSPENLQADANEANAGLLEKLLNNSLPGLEGLVKAHEKAQSHELEEFSKEISALHKENDKTIIFKLKEEFENELEEKSKEIISQFENELDERDKKIFLFLKIIAGLSGFCVILSLVKLFI
ncbi:MAG: hypothetical protein IJ859_04100 [Synergistaceae bacterium]|nr:hypothetical protein [Synergistaceae bacterium]